MKAGGGPTRSRSHATTTAKRRRAPKASRVSSLAKPKVESSAKTEIEQLVLELQEARERQAATAEVLSLISDSPTGIQPVFDRIVKNAARLCQSVLSAVYRRDGDHVDLVAHDQFSPESVAAVRKAYPAPLTSKNLISVAIRERRVVHEPDVLVSGGYSELQRTSGYRSILVVPMLRDEVAIGAIAVMRLEPVLFPKAQVELLKTFAGQAVVAIENTRLFTEVQATVAIARGSPRRAGQSRTDREAGRAGKAGGGRRSRAQHPRRHQPDRRLGIPQQDRSI